VQVLQLTDVDVLTGSTRRSVCALLAV
jgi:hypothetical protein